MPNIQQTEKNAGHFSLWLREFVDAMKSGSGMSVPCDGCASCCTSAYFIHVSPNDTAALQHIPAELLFPAPGLPEGHFLMGVTEAGACPMFKDGRCQIYEWRPLTCRQFDCRVLTAVAPVYSPRQRPAVAAAANGFVFKMQNADDTQQFSAVQHAATFLRDYRNRFSRDVLPANEEQLALLAIRIRQLFMDDGEAHINVAERIAAIESLLSGAVKQIKQG